MARPTSSPPFADIEMAQRVQAHDWATTALGPMAQWPQSLAATLRLVLRMPQPASLCWGAEAILLYNDAYRAILGDKHPQALGRPLTQVWPEIGEVLKPAIESVLAGEPQLWEDVSFDLAGRGEDLSTGWFMASWTPLEDGEGGIGGFLLVASETTARHQAEARLRERETDLARVQRVGGVGGMDIDVAGGLRSWRSPEYLRLHGLPPDTLVESHENWRARLHPADREAAEAALFAALAGPATSYENSYRIVRPSDGAVRWIQAKADIERDSAGKPLRLVGAHVDVTEQHEAQAVLRESQARQGFLLRLSDALRPMTDAQQMRATACRLLGEQLQASRVYYVAYEPEEGYGLVADDYLRPGLPSLAGRYPFEAFRSTYERISNGLTWIVPDVTRDPELPAAERNYYAVQGVRAWVNVPFLHSGRLEAVLCVVQTEARDWSAAEIGLVEDTAERLWSAIQRGRAEAALRENEERFRRFAEASSDVLWMRDAQTLDVEFISAAAEATLGLSPEDVAADCRQLLALVIPEDREMVNRQLAAIRGGAALVYEYRVQRPSDLAFRWIRTTGFPLTDADGRVERIAGISSDVTEIRKLSEHQSILLAELQHRVRNIMAMIRSITARSADGVETVGDYRDRLSGRLTALSRVQVLLTRQANAGGLLGDIVEGEIAALAQSSDQYVLGGPAVMLGPKAVEVLTLAVHELATNAVKYGALALQAGRVTVAWRVEARDGMSWLIFDWCETGGPDRAAGQRRGFGSELIEARIPYDLGGFGRLTIESSGAQCHLELPLSDSQSVLETDAPRPAAIFGGALDMQGATSLAGRTILVVEDDFYTASDTAAAVRGAGGEVLGPSPSAEIAERLLATRTPAAAVVDINLGGGGPSFALARLLRAKGVPFVFLTGYEAQAIPADLRDVERLEKPASLRHVVEAVARAAAGEGG